MDDDELQAIRSQRMAQLQSQYAVNTCRILAGWPLHNHRDGLRVEQGVKTLRT